MGSFYLCFHETTTVFPLRLRGTFWVTSNGKVPSCAYILIEEQGALCNFPLVVVGCIHIIMQGCCLLSDFQRDTKQIREMDRHRTDPDSPLLEVIQKHPFPTGGCHQFQFL